MKIWEDEKQCYIRAAMEKNSEAENEALKAQLDALHALPDNCWFVNYLRCHDDIGWGLDEAVENRLGIDPQKHKEYLYHFYEGNFPGSWAKGELKYIRSLRSDLIH